MIKTRGLRNFTTAVLAITLSVMLAACNESDPIEEDLTSPQSPTLRAVVLAIEPFTVAENAASPKVLLTLSSAQPAAFNFTWTISGITVPPTTDFTSLSGTVTIPAGATNYLLPIPIVDDALFEHDETFKLTISNVPTAVTLKSTSVDFVVIDNETMPIARFATSAQSVSEASPTGAISISLTPASATATEITFSIAGTATSPGDYTLNPTATIIIPPGQNSRPISVAIFGDNVPEASETIIATLNAVTAGEADIDQSAIVHTFTITNDDATKITNVTSTQTNGTYRTGVIPVDVVFNSPVAVTGIPTLLLETGATDRNASYFSGSGTNTLRFNYTVQAGDSTADLDYQSTSALSLSGGSITAVVNGESAVRTLPAVGAAGSLGANKNIVIDAVAPLITSVSSSVADGFYRIGETIPITVTFSESVTVTGTPNLTLETGVADRVIDYVSGSGTSQLLFNYVVQAGDATPDLDYVSTTSLTVVSASIKDGPGNDAVLILPAPGASGSIGNSKSILIDTINPTAASAVSHSAWTKILTESPAVSWSAGADADSGIDSYEFSIGTSAGAIDVLGWTSNAMLLSRTQTGFSLTEGTRYYANVRVKDRAGNYSTTASSAGWQADVTLPSVPATLTDGATSSVTNESPLIEWAASTDALSGVARYELAIGTAVGLTDVVNWKSVGTALSQTETGLALTEFRTYYASIRSVDVAGNISSAQNADGWVIGWLQQARLSASNAATSDLQGSAVSLSGDTVAVGAPAKSSGRGAVAIYVRNGAVWSEQQLIQPAGAVTGDRFGSSIALDGNTLVVGAPDEDSSTGGIYVFTRAGSVWSQQAHIIASNPDNNDRYGASVAISGNTIVVGSPNEAGLQTSPINGSSSPAGFDFKPGSGAAYVYFRSGSTWTQESFLKADNSESNDHFGTSVSISGNTIAVGAPDEDSSAYAVINGGGSSSNNSASAAGAAYVFTRSGVNWSAASYLKASAGGSGDRFGLTVSIDGDRIAAGAPIENGTGAAYTFKRTSGSWANELRVTAVNPDASDEYGASVSLSGAFLCIGAPKEASARQTPPVIQGPTASNDNTKSGSGAAYLYRLSDTTWSQVAFMKTSLSNSSQNAGQSVSVSGESIAIGVPKETSDTGAAYIMDR